MVEAEKGKEAVQSGEDIHGKNKMGRNILTSWGSQAVQMVSGFIVPRLIDRGLGTDALGIWDYAWSVVVYFNLVQMGLTGSISRAVAFHRAKNDFAAVNRSVSSVVMVMRGMALVVMALTIFFAWGIGQLYVERFGEHLRSAQWVVFILGTSMAVQTSATVFTSILTGCHRWDWHNGIYTVTNFINMVGMIMALLMGYGLIGLAVVYLASETIGRLARVIVSYKTCPWLEIRLKLFHKETAREMVHFGGKTFLTYVSQLLLFSSVQLLVGSFLGTTMLAIYMRPMALVRALSTFVNKYAMVFSPTISSLQGAGQHDEVRALALKSTRYGLYISLPITLFLALYGGQVLQLWMGDRYNHPALIAILIVGSFFQITYIPMFKALVGLNLHGRPGMSNVIGSALGLLAVFVVLVVFKLGIVAVALTVAITLTLIHGVYLPLYTCRQLNVPAKMFWEEVWRSPILLAIPTTVIFLVGRYFFSKSLPQALGFGGGLGFLALAICYWKAVVPPRLKAKLAFAR